MHNVSKRIAQFEDGRLPEMLAIKHQLMTENIFRFYRGTCHLFYEDLARERSMSKSPLAWICGDLHLENFGSYKGDNRLVYFDLNDFDEAALAPASWELARITTSILLAFEVLKIGKQKGEKMARVFLRSYANTLSNGKAYYIEPQTSKGIVNTFLSATALRKQKELLRKRTKMKENNPVFIVDNKKHFELAPSLKRELTHHIAQWLMYNHEGPFNYEVSDAIFRLAGTGSVGLKRYAFLLKSINKTGPKFLIVDMKQAVPTSLAPFLKAPQPAWEKEAHRIVGIQQRMQNIPPALLSTTIFKEDTYIIQEMQPVKDSINFKLIKDRYRDIYQVIDDMAVLTASSQLRSSGRQGSATADELIAYGQSDKWQEAVLNYATHYATQTKAYYADFIKDMKSKRKTHLVTTP